MFLKKSVGNGRIYLSFVQGYRHNGKVKQKTVEKLGYLDDLQKIYLDPIAHFTKVARQRSVVPEEGLTVDIGKKLEDGANGRRNLGYVAVKRIYNMLDIDGFFQRKQRQLDVEYNLNKIFSLLVFNRFLFPSSKKKAFDERGVFFEKFDFSLDDVYRSLNHFSRYSQAIQMHLYSQVRKTIEVDNQLGYYDVTNYYFEIPYSDEDKYDDKGELIEKGFRQKGPCKEHRPDPIVQMGLLMDSAGIPLAFDIFEGNQSEKTSLLPMVNRVKRDYEMDRIIVVADRGLNTSDNTAFLAGVNDDDSNGYDGYVYGQSVLGADADFKAWTLDTRGYVTDIEIDNQPGSGRNGEPVSFTHKSRIFAKTVQLKNTKGKRKLKMTIYQKQLVYYSQKYADKQKKDRERVLAKARDMIANPQKYSQSTSHGAAGYVKNIKFVKETGEIAQGVDLSLDLEKITEEEKYDGYYAIVTSEKDMSDKQMRDTYSGLWEIEESFKIMKSEFCARPVFLQLRNHINAHFLICFVALLIMRVLQHMTDKRFSPKAIRDSLARYSCSHLDQNYYIFDYRDDFIKSIEHIFNIDLTNKFLTTSQIKNILKNP